jgi:type VI secretion system secreted protein VgrG
VPKIIAQVLEEHGILADAYSFQLNAVPERDYCVQYDESDLHFIQRLCEEEGIHYHFQHSASGHKLVFGDDQTVFRNLGSLPARLRHGRRRTGDQALQPAPGNPHQPHHPPRLRLRKTEDPARRRGKPSPPGPRRLRLPRPLHHRERGKFLHAPSNATAATTNSPKAKATTDPDRPLPDPDRPPARRMERPVAAAEVFHEGKQPQVLEENVTSDTTDNKRRFPPGLPQPLPRHPVGRVLPPTLEHPKPAVLGSQTAVVTGPEGEEIHCDQYGRIKVQFHWDREGQADDKTSCWLRVSSGWAGAATAASPSRASAWKSSSPSSKATPTNRCHRLPVPQGKPRPYDLPANKTRSTFKTLSSPGGSGYNELRIEDKKGAEQIFLHAQRDWDENIEHDQKIRVGNERHDTVEKNTYTNSRPKNTTPSTPTAKSKRANDHLTVGVNQHIKIGTGQFIDAGQEIHLSSGMKVVMEAGAELTLVGGGSFIKIDAGGVTMSGPVINMNSGGSPGSGTGAAPLMPGVLKQADADKAGQVLTPAQINTLKRNAPFCEECEKCKAGACAI